MSSSDEISPARTAPSPEFIPVLTDPDISLQEDIQMKDVENYSSEQILYLIKLSLQCERYMDVIDSLEKLYLYYPQTILSKRNRTILENSLKNYVGVKQKQLNKLNSLLEYSEKNKGKNEVNGNGEQKYLLKAIAKEKERITFEITEFILRTMKLIDTYLLKNNSKGNEIIDKETEVFLLRIKGDCCKYLSQVVMNNDEAYKNLQLAHEVFAKAYATSDELLPVINIEHLNTVTSYADFLCYFIKDLQKAKEILNSIISHEEIIAVLQDLDIVDHEKHEQIKLIAQFYNQIKSL